MKITIAVDGYSSCGKSTLAKAIAAELGYNYIDSGAMYRAVTLYCLDNGIIKSEGSFSADAIVAVLDDITVSFAYNEKRKASDTYLNGVDVEEEIRQMRVSNLVSPVSAIAAVRKKMVALQRKLGKGKGVVMDGRDIGTNVFPDAELKIFMTADHDVRTRRRYDELKAKGIIVTLAEVRENLASRDHEDSTRKENPLTKAEDAILLDNSELDRQEQLDLVMEIVRERVSGKKRV